MVEIVNADARFEVTERAGESLKVRGRSLWVRSMSVVRRLEP